MKNKLIFVLVFVIAIVALEAMVLTKKSEAEVYNGNIWEGNSSYKWKKTDGTWTFDTETKVLTITLNGVLEEGNNKYAIGEIDEEGYWDSRKYSF